MLNKQSLLSTLLKFHSAFNNYGYDTYDPYDLMSSDTGQFLRSVYFKNKPIGLLLGGPYFMTDLIFPKIRHLISQKKRYANADAHLILGYVNLYYLTKKQIFIELAIELGEHLIKTSIDGFSGHCWGYPFDWVSHSGKWKKGTPFITVTPYCYEAFITLHEATHEQKFADTALSITKFVLNDLKETRIDQNTLICSYSPFDTSRVINANAYRSFVLCHASAYFNMPSYMDKVHDHLNFIRMNQRADGSWLYESNNDYNNFIDNIHTCFVLKNLIKCNLVLKSSDISETILNGLNFYSKFLISKDFSLLSFVKNNKFSFFRESLYDYAEAINLFLLSQPYDQKFKNILNQLLKRVLSYQLSNGFFIDRITILQTKQTIPFIRWGQSQMFSSLSSLALNNDSNPLISESPYYQ